MAKLLNLKIDKERLYRGEKGTYLNITVAVKDDGINTGITYRVGRIKPKKNGSLKPLKII